MSALVRHVLGEVPLRTGTRVTRLERVGEGWRVHATHGSLGVWDRVVLTAPAPQTEALLRTADSPLADRVGQVRMAPCWAAMVRGEAGLDVDGLRFSRGPVAWMGRQDVLAGREGSERWVVHASAEWSLAHLEDDPEDVARAMRAVFAGVTGRSPESATAHRWRYSLVTESLGVDCLADDGLLVAGDGCLGGRVEAAWLSGAAAAGVLLREACVE